MPEDSERFAELIEWLRDQDYTEAQVAKILERIKQYDDGTKFVSEMDSIERGDFQIAAIIEEALADAEDQDA